MRDRPKQFLRPLAIVLALSAPFWLSVPIGKWSYVDEWGDGAHEGSIDLIGWRFFFPREIQMEGIPLPGGDFGFLDDPHYLATEPDQISVETPEGRSVNLIVQLFDVNYGFYREKHIEHILAVSYDDELYEYDVSPLQAMNAMKYVQVIGWLPDRMIAYLPHHFIASTRTRWSNMFILVDWSDDGPGVNAEIVFENDAARWQTVFDSLASNPSPLLDRLCEQRVTYAHAFKERVTGTPCPIVKWKPTL